MSFSAVWFYYCSGDMIDDEDVILTIMVSTKLTLYMVLGRVPESITLHYRFTYSDSKFPLKVSTSSVNSYRFECKIQ